MEKYKDYLEFKKMIVPIIIKFLFWIGVALCLLLGLIQIIKGASANYGGGGMVLTGLLTMLVGPLAVRIQCELLIVIFSINDTLTDIKGLLGKDKA